MKNNNITATVNTNDFDKWMSERELDINLIRHHQELLKDGRFHDDRTDTHWSWSAQCWLSGEAYFSVEGDCGTDDEYDEIHTQAIAAVQKALRLIGVAVITSIDFAKSIEKQFGYAWLPCGKFDEENEPIEWVEIYWSDKTMLDANNGFKCGKDRIRAEGLAKYQHFTGSDLENIRDFCDDIYNPQRNIRAVEVFKQYFDINDQSSVAEFCYQLASDADWKDTTHGKVGGVTLDEDDEPVPEATIDDEDFRDLVMGDDEDDDNPPFIEIPEEEDDEAEPDGDDFSFQLKCAIIEMATRGFEMAMPPHVSSLPFVAYFDEQDEDGNRSIQCRYFTEAVYSEKYGIHYFVSADSDNYNIFECQFLGWKSLK